MRRAPLLHNLTHLQPLLQPLQWCAGVGATCPSTSPLPLPPHTHPSPHSPLPTLTPPLTSYNPSRSRSLLISLIHHQEEEEEEDIR